MTQGVVVLLLAFLKKITVCDRFSSIVVEFGYKKVWVMWSEQTNEHWNTRMASDFQHHICFIVYSFRGWPSLKEFNSNLNSFICSKDTFGKCSFTQYWIIICKMPYTLCRSELPVEPWFNSFPFLLLLATSLLERQFAGVWLFTWCLTTFVDVWESVEYDVSFKPQ